MPEREPLNQDPEWVYHPDGTPAFGTIVDVLRIQFSKRIAPPELGRVRISIPDLGIAEGLGLSSGSYSLLKRNITVPEGKDANDYIGRLGCLLDLNSGEMQLLLDSHIVDMAIKRKVCNIAELIIQTEKIKNAFNILLSGERLPELENSAARASFEQKKNQALQQLRRERNIPTAQ